KKSGSGLAPGRLCPRARPPGALRLVLRLRGPATLGSIRCLLRSRILTAGAMLVVAGWLTGTSPALTAWAAPPGPTIPPPPPAKALLLVDLTAGRVLYRAHRHVLPPPPRPPKGPTALIALRRLPPRAPVPASAHAAGVYPDKVGMKPGQRWPLTIALHALLISSANDAAYALAERVGVSVERFAVIMGAAATQMGMTDHPVLRD